MKSEEKFKTRQIRNTPGHIHFLTFSTRKKRPSLLNEQICIWLADAIDRARVKHDFEVLAYVFMPDHVHLLIQPRQVEYKISEILKSIKQGVSRKAINASLVEEMLWETGGGHDRNIFSEEARINAIAYIHMNPVRKELCVDILEYKWSSARELVLGEKGAIEIDGYE